MIMISATMNQRLNEQINSELSTSYAYLAMSCRLDQMGLRILAQFFARQSSEEREHAAKILKYVQEVDGTVELGMLAAPAGDYQTVPAVAQAALDSELTITRQINDLVTLAEEEKDYATRNFLMWFVDEQVEEVASMRELVQLIELAGSDNLLQVEARLRHQMTAKS